MTFARHQWVLLLVGTVGLAGSLLTAQFILASRGWRIDLTPDKRYELSDHTRRILGELEDDVRVVAFLRSGDSRNRDIEDLLWRFSLVSERVRYRVVDVNRNPALAREYGVDAYGSIAVESGNRRRNFSNPTEELLVAAIVQVTQPGNRRVYFLTGHGERGTKPSGDRHGFSLARAALMAERYEVGEISLVAEREIPADAAALIIAGPRSDLLTAELLRLDAYVQNGGSVLILLDPGNAPGLVAMLARYGVSVSHEVLLDPENRLFAGDFLTLLVPERSSAHPVSDVLQSPVLMSQIRAVRFEAPERVDSGIELFGLELLKTSKDSWSTPDLNVLKAGVGRFVDGRDTHGPIPVAVSVLVRSRQGPVGRILVFGDADFGSDPLLGYLGNRDLLLNSVNWLAGEQRLIGSRQPSKEPGVNQFFVSARQGRLAFLLGTVVEPLFFLAVGTLVFLRRRFSG